MSRRRPDRWRIAFVFVVQKVPQYRAFHNQRLRLDTPKAKLFSGRSAADGPHATGQSSGNRNDEQGFEAMTKSKFLAVALAIAMGMSSFSASAIINPPPGPGVVHSSSASSNYWWFFACPGDVVVAAIVMNWNGQQVLTEQSAWPCGLLYWYN
jgi:hypothetical protein